MIGPPQRGARKLNAKTWRSKQYSGNADSREHVCMMLAGIVHMDHLWRRLQVMDEAGNAMLDLALEDTNPYCIAAKW